MHIHYILDDQRRPVPVDPKTWMDWFETSAAQRLVAETMCGDWRVSTIFLSLNHSDGEGPPVLWETSVFHGTEKLKLAKGIKYLNPPEDEAPEVTELIAMLREAVKHLPNEIEIECCVSTMHLQCAGGVEQAEAMHAEMVARVEAVRALELPDAQEPAQNQP
jgi:hypothetical protein